MANQIRLRVCASLSAALLALTTAASMSRANTSPAMSISGIAGAATQLSEFERQLQEFARVMSAETAAVPLPAPIVRAAPSSQQDDFAIKGSSEPDEPDFTWELFLIPEMVVGKSPAQLRYLARFMICVVEMRRHSVMLNGSSAQQQYYLETCIFRKYPEAERLEYVAIYKDVYLDHLARAGIPQEPNEVLLQRLLVYYRVKID